MNLAKLSRSPRAMKAFTGLSYEEFTNLVPVFKAAYIAIKMANPAKTENGDTYNLITKCMVY